MQYNFEILPDRRLTESSKWQAYDEDVLPLPVADMDFLSPQPVIDALRQRSEHGVFGYPEDIHGKIPLVVSLRTAFFVRLERLYGWKVDSQALVLMPGVVPGLNLACQALAQPGGGVLIQTPVYSPFLYLAHNANAKPQIS